MRLLDTIVPQRCDMADVIKLIEKIGFPNVHKSTGCAEICYDMFFLI